MTTDQITKIRHMEGHLVLVTTDENTIEALLISACRGARRTLWLQEDESDSFLPLARVRSVSEKN
ncbi:MAG: hypothetical protein HKL81_09295 [Acidimicrobiaceae bacterium]|nr:hypothetical protein [Acidimicrobiaceae bacterium]